jgi:hypothetical protein
LRRLLQDQRREVALGREIGLAHLELGVADLLDAGTTEARFRTGPSPVLPEQPE